MSFSNQENIVAAVWCSRLLSIQLIKPFFGQHQLLNFDPTIFQLTHPQTGNIELGLSIG
jgi:hypothetical protein